MAEKHDVDAPVFNPQTVDEGGTGGFRADESGLCLSGGGYRAMVFHIGTILRLNELGILRRLNRISSVSGGSITAAVLGMNWKELGLAAGPASAAAMEKYFVKPLREMASTSIDVSSGLKGIFSPFSNISDQIEAGYADTLFGKREISALPRGANTPRFVINATNVQTGALFRFTSDYVADYKLGQASPDGIPLAKAVAASSAFPPFLSPCILKRKLSHWFNKSGAYIDPDDDEYRTRLVLSDGGVYDNLGLESVWKRCGTVLVSDAGMRFSFEEEPSEDWARHSRRVLDLVDSQVRNLRKRMLLASLTAPATDQNHRKGAYWSVGSELAKYAERDGFVVDQDKVRRDLATYRTGLSSMDDTIQERLINWGYVICNAAVRTHAGAVNNPGAKLPYPRAGV